MRDRLITGICGLAGGVAGLAAMAVAFKGARPPKETEGALPRPRSMSVVGEHHAPGEPATEGVARTLYEKATGRVPPQATKRRLGQVVHYGYGLVMAAGYGLVRGRRRGLDLTGGVAFAVGLWALGDELAVPLLGLADAPTSQPLRAHAQFLVAHLAYGVATAATAQALARLI